MSNQCDVANWLARNRVIGGSLRRPAIVQIASHASPTRQAAASDIDFRTGGRSDQRQDFVDPLPAIHRLALADEIRLPAGEPLQRAVSPSASAACKCASAAFSTYDHVDKVRAVAHAPQPARPGPRDQPRNQMMYPAAPRSDAAAAHRSASRVAVRREHRLFRERLRVRIVGRCHHPVGYGADSSTPH